LLEGLLVACEKFLRHRESLFVRKRLAVVHHGNSKPRRVRGSRHRHRNMPAAEQIRHRLRQDGLDKNFQRTPANQPVIVVGLIVQVKNHFPRRFFLHHFLCGGPDLRLHAASANGSLDRAVFANEHPRALITGNRAVRVHNGSQRSTLPRAPHLYDFFEQVHRFQAFFGGTAALGGAALSLIASAYGAPFKSARYRSWPHCSGEKPFSAALLSASLPLRRPRPPPPRSLRKG